MAEKTPTGSDNKALFEVPADVFYGKIGLFKGDGVLVSLAPSGRETCKTTRLVPKVLLFYYSKICEEKFEPSPFEMGSESDQQLIHISEQDNHLQRTRKLGVIELSDWDAEDFDMALQWMYTGNVIPGIDSTKAFEEVHSYIKFFKIATALQLSGSFRLVEQKLRVALITAQEQHDGENEYLFTCNPVFKETLKDAFTHPINDFVRELLASFFVESYFNHLFCPDEITANTFGDLFKAVEGLELEVLRLVGSSLKSILLGKPKDGLSKISLICPLTKMRFDTEKKLKVKQVTPKFPQPH